MKAILCALDFSEASDNVVKIALEMAAQKHENLVILYAYRLLQPDSQDIKSYRNTMEQHAKTEFSALARRLNINGEVPLEFRAEIGFLSDRIDIYRQKNEVDIIVIGQRLAHAINEHKGLSFEQFLDVAKVPVLVVPNDYTHQ
jgi:nucleotide-binding universal stress UspA family protein